MRVHYLQHVEFEGLSSIELILKEKGHQLSSTQLYKKPELPSVNDIDWLIIMGGPMGVYDEEIYPWLKTEKQFIKDAIDSGLVVLGICLGAQLIAEVLGAKITKNSYREIGWFTINRLTAVHDTILSSILPEQIEVFHWHGDTFDIPEGAIAVVKSDACLNQGFILDNRVIAFQFHLETTMESVSALIENCRDEIDGSKYVQSEEEMLANTQRFTRINQLMFSVLDVLESNNAASR